MRRLPHAQEAGGSSEDHLKWNGRAAQRMPELQKEPLWSRSFQDFAKRKILDFNRQMNIPGLLL